MDPQASRPAVPPPPPAYATINRVTRGKSLRGVVLVCTIGGFIWSLVVGVAYLRAMSHDGLTTRLKMVYLIQGVLFLVLAGLETIGMYTVYTVRPHLLIYPGLLPALLRTTVLCVYTADCASMDICTTHTHYLPHQQQKIKAGRLYVWAVILGGCLVTAAETIRMALHFVFKTDLKAACQTRYAGDTADFASNADVQDWCDSDWQNGIWRDAAWLIFGLICSVFMYILSRAYYHQLLDPNFGRTTGAASNRFRLQQMGPPAAAVPYGQDPPFVPPYSNGGMPDSAAGYAEPPGYNNHDAPAYTPPEKGSNPFANSDVKSGDIGQRRNEEDLESQAQHLNANNGSDDTLPGRQREGRV